MGATVFAGPLKQWYSYLFDVEFMPSLLKVLLRMVLMPSLLKVLLLPGELAAGARASGTPNTHLQTTTHAPSIADELWLNASAVDVPDPCKKKCPRL